MIDKKQIRIVLLGVALSGTMASCQKDEFQSEILVSQEMSLKNKAHVSHTLQYWIDGVEYNASFTSEAEKSAYISYLIGLTLEGREITIGGSENPSMAPESSDKLTFKTSDEAEMGIWVNDLEKKGYNVTVSFDKETGLYTGTATPPGGGSRTTMTLSRE